MIARTSPEVSHPEGYQYPLFDFQIIAPGFKRPLIEVPIKAQPSELVSLVIKPDADQRQVVGNARKVLPEEPTIYTVYDKQVKEAIRINREARDRMRIAQARLAGRNYDSMNPQTREAVRRQRSRK